MSNQGCEQFDELCALVAAGAATPEEEQALQAHMAAGCSSCLAAYRSRREVIAHLVETLPPLTPPPAVRTRLLEAIAQEAALAPGRLVVASSPARPSRFAWPWATGWALVAALLLVLLWRVDVQQKTDRHYAAELQALQRELADKDAALQFVEARNTHTVGLKGLPDAPNTAGKVFWNPESNAGLLVVFNMPPPPPGKVYQLWAIPQGLPPVDAGTFSPDPQGIGSMKVRPLPDPKQRVQIFAITAEPMGGSSKPTGNMYVQGTLNAY